MQPRDASCYEQLLRDGFCVFKYALDSANFAALRQGAEYLLDSQSEE